MSNTPQKFAGCLRLCPTENTFGGDPVCACGCVNASQKCGRSPRFAFLRVTPKLSRCSLIFAPRNQRVFLYAVGGFLPVADAIFSPTRKIKDFSRGDPEAPRVDFARRTDGAKCAIPSHFVLLTNPPTSSTQPQGIMSNTPAKICGVFAFMPHRKYFRRGPRIAAAFKRRLCRRIMTRALPSFPAS